MSGRGVANETGSIRFTNLLLHKGTQCSQLWSCDKQTQTDPEIRDWLCNRCGQLNRLRNDTLRLLGDSKTNVPIEVPVTVDALQQQTRQTELLDKQTKLLQPDAWKCQHKQQEEELQFQEEQQQKEAERKKVARLQELWAARQRQNQSDWEERMMLRVLEPAAATKSVPVSPLTQPSRPPRLAKLPPLPKTGQLLKL